MKNDIKKIQEHSSNESVPLSFRRASFGKGFDFVVRSYGFRSVNNLFLLHPFEIQTLAKWVTWPITLN